MNQIHKYSHQLFKLAFDPHFAVVSETTTGMGFVYIDGIVVLGGVGSSLRARLIIRQTPDGTLLDAERIGDRLQTPFNRQAVIDYLNQYEP